MPEAPEMQVVAEFLQSQLPGLPIDSVQILKPSVVRSLAGDLAEDAVGRKFRRIERRGKFLLLCLSGERTVVINPKLAGGLQFAPGKQRVLKKTCVRFQLRGEVDLRYVDDRQMGQFYYVPDDQVDTVPGLAEQGPDVLAETSFEDFKNSLKGFSGEIKGVLTRGRVVSGIGNAYADEILFHAGVYPFKRRKALSEDELRRIHHSCRQVVVDAIETVRERMGVDIDHKVRDFLAVHNKGGVSPVHGAETRLPNCGRTSASLASVATVSPGCCCETDALTGPNEPR